VPWPEQGAELGVAGVGVGVEVDHRHPAHAVAAGHPVTSGRAMVWSPPRTTGTAPASATAWTASLEPVQGRWISPGQHQHVAGVDHPQLPQGVHAEGQRRAGSRRGPGSRCRGWPRGRTGPRAGGWCRRRRGRRRRPRRRPQRRRVAEVGPRHPEEGQLGPVHGEAAGTAVRRVTRSASRPRQDVGRLPGRLGGRLHAGQAALAGSRTTAPARAGPAAPPGSSGRRPRSSGAGPPPGGPGRAVGVGEDAGSRLAEPNSSPSSAPLGTSTRGLSTSSSTQRSNSCRGVSKRSSSSMARGSRPGSCAAGPAGRGAGTAATSRCR
jgi:hypothetical protein